MTPVGAGAPPVVVVVREMVAVGAMVVLMGVVVVVVSVVESIDDLTTGLSLDTGELFSRGLVGSIAGAVEVITEAMCAWLVGVARGAAVATVAPVTASNSCLVLAGEFAGFTVTGLEVMVGAVGVDVVVLAAVGAVVVEVLPGELAAEDAGEMVDDEGEDGAVGDMGPVVTVVTGVASLVTVELSLYTLATVALLAAVDAIVAPLRVLVGGVVGAGMAVVLRVGVAVIVGVGVAMGVGLAMVVVRMLPVLLRMSPMILFREAVLFWALVDILLLTSG